MWMNRLTRVQKAQVGVALNQVRDGLDEPKTDSKVAAIIGISPPHLSKFKNQQVITPTLWHGLVDAGLVQPRKKRIRLSADVLTVEQRNACHKVAQERGLTWSQYVQRCATSGKLENHVLELVAKLAHATDSEKKMLIGLICVMGIALDEANKQQQEIEDDNGKR